jgi:hypothetical protein
MDQEQVDLFEPEAFQTRFGGAHEIGRREIGPPDLGGDEDVAPGDAGRPQSRSDSGFIVVGCRGVDMAIADRQGVRHHFRTVIALQRPCAEAERGNCRSIGVDIVHGKFSGSCRSHIRDNGCATPLQ